MIWGLLAGLFLAPVALLWLGHRLRRRAPGARAVFWGATIGHSLGIIATLAAVHYPPVLWTDGWRAVAVHWSMVAGALLGAAAGAAAGRGR
ncbi:hypothetical protein [Longimicrobium sp.]|jgi:hypothetical protein|uniref:hypothetical protein n=1 Tax=Longimicrobium sp. TaxID=2029185 RepID=UPI002EDB6625